MSAQFNYDIAVFERKETERKIVSKLDVIRSYQQRQDDEEKEVRELEDNNRYLVVFPQGLMDKIDDLRDMFSYRRQQLSRVQNELEQLYEKRQQLIKQMWELEQDPGCHRTCDWVGLWHRDLHDRQTSC